MLISKNSMKKIKDKINLLKKVLEDCFKKDGENFIFQDVNNVFENKITDVKEIILNDNIFKYLTKL